MKNDEISLLFPLASHWNALYLIRCTVREVNIIKRRTSNGKIVILVILRKPAHQSLSFVFFCFFFISGKVIICSSVLFGLFFVCLFRPDWSIFRSDRVSIFLPFFWAFSRFQDLQRSCSDKRRCRFERVSIRTRARVIVSPIKRGFSNLPYLSYLSYLSLSLLLSRSLYTFTHPESLFIFSISFSLSHTHTHFFSFSNHILDNKYSFPLFRTLSLSLSPRCALKIDP